MQIRELSIPDSYEITPKQFADDRGVFLEWYRFDKLAEVVGHPIDLRQANTSVSKRGVVRGIHFADVPLGQAKYVTCTHGAVLDFVIDIRVGSPTFGQWDSVLLDDVDRKAIYISEGLGHAFVALSDNATVSYLVTDVFNAPKEHGINPLDTTINLVFPPEAGEPLLSPKDTDAPSLNDAAASGLLPTWDDMRAYYQSLTDATVAKAAAESSTN
ncbi:MAG: dTDP-4-dehydrorhamnose 3,5-epimerase [Glaciihabitans sp.]|nr:dTDP-4-dehydrorhamnose 3,5-epimerase [Glaciihabitans sp.]